MHSWTPILRRLFIGLAVLGVAGAASAQLGTNTTTAACCQLTTSLIQDVLRGKDSSGDERFFSAEGAPPNIHFIIDTSGSMKELPQLTNSDHAAFFNGTTNGCVNPWLDATITNRNWNKDFPYPVPDQGTGFGGDDGFPNLFQDAMYYGYGHWGDLSSPTPNWISKEVACGAQVPGGTSNSTEYNRCLECLSTKGYFKTSSAVAGTTSLDFIFWGRFLNFNPPKYVTAKVVLKQVIAGLSRVRAGFSRFNSPVPGSPNLSVNQQGMNPSCSQILNDSSSFDSNRAAYISKINALTFNTSTPLARSLLNTGYYFTSDDGVYKDVFGFGSGTGAAYFNYPTDFKGDQLTSQGRTICWGCQVSSIIIVTDGEPSSDAIPSTVVTKLRDLNGGAVYCPSGSPCIGKRPNPPFADWPDNGTNKTNDSTGWADDNNQYLLDDVAKLLHTKDLQRHDPPVVGDFNTAGDQTVSVYTVGFGVNSNLLKNAALVGGGDYYTASDQEGLKTALLEIIANVQTRATSFSAAAASTVQVRNAGATLIPRFKPSKNKLAPWQGFLYRFDIASEKILGCKVGNMNDDTDLNGDDDCEDTHIIDADGDAVLENDLGDFVKLRTPNTPAKWFWEAGSVMRPPAVDPEDMNDPLNQTQNWKTRNIFTIVDSNNDGKLDRNDTTIAFTEANSGVLREYLGISQNPGTCEDLRVQLGLTSLTPDECTKLIIRWYRGANAIHGDPARRDYDRPYMLHDIFHSSPISVEPPMARFYCAFSGQCTQTLFNGKTAKATGYTIPGKDSVDAYDKYVYESGKRDKVVLVGSNGGMLHAFHNGKFDKFDEFTGMPLHKPGTGKELWAFIPPDLLPKLRTNLGRHAYFVDGTPMVREVWMDGVGSGSVPDGIKQWAEYRTVAVVGTGRGGVHRFALDITDLLKDDLMVNERLPTSTGVEQFFLWMWPQPCDDLALKVGESFSNFAPNPPPIVPVALSPEADNALRVMTGHTGGAADPWSIPNAETTPPTLPARERWVVMFNGGYDQYLLRGRGMAMVDLMSGHTIWSFFHNDGQDRSANLRYPIVAGVTMQDIGKGTASYQEADLLMDTATVGDFGGQLWMVRFWQPGRWDTLNKRVDNWFAARSFRVENPPGWTDPEAVRAPFTYMATSTIQPGTGYMRTFIGTGDNQNLLDKGSVCRISNPHACAAQGCGVNNNVKITRGGTLVWDAKTTYASYALTSITRTTAATTAACGGVEAELLWDFDKTSTCDNESVGSIKYTCTGDSSTWSCSTPTDGWAAINAGVATKPYPQRYYGFWSYGGGQARRFDTNAQANTYEAGMLKDSNLTNVGQFDANGKVISTATSADPNGNGWMINYAQTNERTGNSGTLLNGCMIWGSFEPSGSAGVVCSTTGTNLARLYQADFATGKADCAEGFYTQETNTWARYITFTTVANAPAPRPQLTMANGQLSLSLPLLGAGVKLQGATEADSLPGANVTSSESAVKSLYQIELDRRAHDCRHEGKPGSCE